ncbi:hypothetical protein [Terrimonas pollutisoli]|uniref:hypothetical protein n=1 Tax=Terrimonas pollutisoli TaxID=3034147 RepID=UPI0023EDCE2C|nr:hypothetical protein [Terrimonas sp. H1YJ31]
MKKQFFLITTLFIAIASFSQSEKYTKAMEQLVPAVDTTMTPDGLNNLANSFQRIADAEKNQWLPYYYAAFANVSAAYMMSMGQMGMADKTDPIADKAESLLNKADELSKDNSEIYCVKKMIASLRLIGDPQNRYMTFGPAAEEALATAKSLNPANPRVTLLEAQDKLFTPEQFGGSKTEAKALFEEAIKKFEAFKPESTIHPSWGLRRVQYFLTQVK